MLPDFEVRKPDEALSARGVVRRDDRKLFAAVFNLDRSRAASERAVSGESEVC